MRSALLALILLSSPVLANEKASQPSDETAPAAPAEVEKKICKRIAASESRMASKRICMTAAEWKKSDERNGY